MNSHPRDEDLLMLAHDALPLAQRLPAQVHLVFCSQCRARVSRLERASQAIADTVRGRGAARWALPFSQGAVAAAQIAVAWLIALLVTIVLTFVVATHALHRPAAVAHPASQTAPGGGCRPDLPSDQCR